MERNKIITIVPCQPAEVDLEDRKLLTSLDLEPQGYIGRIPFYYLNNREQYNIYCCIMSMRKISTIEEFVYRAKQDLQNVLMNQELCLPIVVCVEKPLIKPLIDEFENPFSGPVINYFLADVKMNGEVRTSLRKVIISKIRNNVAHTLSIKIGKNEVILN